MNDYRGHHQAPGPDDVAQCFTTLGQDNDSVYPTDVLVHPDRYGAYNASTAALIRAAQTLDCLTIYRAVPPGVDTINPGDWVAISEEYARTHSYGLLDGTIDDGSTDGVILSVEVPAATLWSEGVLEEWGYHGPAIAGLRAI
ncbi:hypothetical protein [Gordonia sihwensis]|uniref:hypothetical protein n=1 Tax=Gordonia sihwensis TaxID=173559 RepID=UPI003D97997B